MTEDSRYYQTYYGISVEDWSINYGTLSNCTYILVKDYISDVASVASNTEWSSEGSDGIIFLYPHHLKKKYFIEGVVEGQITFTSKNATSFVSDYRVSIVKIGEDATETELASTGVIEVNDTYEYDAIWHTGTDIVYPFWIDVFSEPQEITEDYRIGVKIEWDVNHDSSTTVSLMHDNDPTYEDMKITIPFLL